MNKKGFTLIELLAVIVVLAIIAVIATPVVMNVINQVQEKSVKRSAERYIDAVELAIATETLDSNVADGLYVIKNGGSLCFKGTTCTDIPTLKVEITGNTPEAGGTIAIKDGKVVKGLTSTEITKFQIGNYIITLDENGNVKMELLGKNNIMVRISSSATNYSMDPIKSSSGVGNANINNGNINTPALQNITIDDDTTNTYRFWFRNDGDKTAWLNYINLGKVDSNVEIKLIIDDNEFDLTGDEVYSYCGPIDLHPNTQQQIILSVENNSGEEISLNDITFGFVDYEYLTPDILP